MCVGVQLAVSTHGPALLVRRPLCMLRYPRPDLSCLPQLMKALSSYTRFLRGPSRQSMLKASSACTRPVRCT